VEDPFPRLPLVAGDYDHLVRYFLAIFFRGANRSVDAAVLYRKGPACFFTGACYSCLALLYFSPGAFPMEWTTPQHEEIDLNCEISSYANAEL
jgi:hypothetical protein